MAVTEKQFEKTAKDLLATIERLDLLLLTHRDQAKELGRGTIAASAGGPLHHQIVVRDQKVAVVLGLSSLKLDKYGSIKSRAFFHGARLAGLAKPIVTAVKGIPLARQPEPALKTRFPK